MPSDAHTYPGAELDLFAAARHWKAYWASAVIPHLAGDVLEVGAGIGMNTALLAREHVGRWVCLEPDPVLAARIRETWAGVSPDHPVDVRVNTVQDLPAERAYDTALYIDVLEHIEDDAAELAAVTARIRDGGSVVVLAPAYQSLFSPFDAAVGHYRRYNRRMIESVAPPNLALTRIEYFDSIGIAASAANRWLLRRTVPTASQIRFWDDFLVPVSRVVDRWIGHRCGRSILAVWKAVP